MAIRRGHVSAADLITEYLLACSLRTANAGQKRGAALSEAETALWTNKVMLGRAVRLQKSLDLERCLIAGYLRLPRFVVQN
jgi:hypothetical protein